MPWLIRIVSFVYIWITVIYAQILHECNFDTATIIASSLLPEVGSRMLVTERIGNASNQPPAAPLSDVTSSLKPTDNGQPCNLPYKVNPYNWDMYFCNNGFCETTSNPNSTCTPGRFGHYNFLVLPTIVTFTLNTDSGGTNGTGQQCLIYYYYLPTINRLQQNIIVRKQEPGGNNETIDIVTNSSFNGWMKRQVSFSTVKPGYKIYFTFEKTSGLSSPPTIIAIDEISVRLGSCPSEPVTQITATVPIKTTTESETVLTSCHSSVIEISTVQTTTIDTTEPPTIISTMELTTTMTTITSNNSSMELPTLSTETTSSDTSTTSSALINPSTEVNNTYIIVLATILPAVLIGIIGIAICIKKCSPNRKISPSAFELNQRPPPPSQT